VVGLDTTQTGATWGLDRIDQRKLPLDHTYTYTQTGKGVYAFILDTGVRSDHIEFAGRLAAGANFVAGSAGTGDCMPDGHGTKVAGVVGGIHWCVAKDVTIVPLRVTNCIGWLAPREVAAAIDWVIAHQEFRPAVINLSAGGGIEPAIDAAVENALAHGIAVIAAAGNANTDACTSTPARVDGVITVGASNRSDQRMGSSNFGSCVAVFAPGEDINTASSVAPNAVTSATGTSFAAAFVTGIVAQMLERRPDASPQDIRAAVIGAAVPDQLEPGSLGAGSPNLLANGSIGANRSAQ
jgi:aqualysin 1